jgi:hypothetical protein
MTAIFDLTYYGLSVIMLGMLGSTAVVGFALRPALGTPGERNEALGVSLAALGALLTLVSGVVFLEIERAGGINDLLYQQAHFALFYVGFALVLYGVLATSRRWDLPLWLGFALTTILAAVFLFNPNSYTYAQSGARMHAAQQVVFFLPLFYTTAAGVLLLPLRAARARLHPMWFALCCAALLVGLLRESRLIPSLGDPELDLLMAFGPFVAAALCLLLTIRSLVVETNAQRG